MRSRLFSIPGLLVLIVVGMFAVQPFASPKTAQATSPLTVDSLWCEQVAAYPNGTLRAICYAFTSGGTGTHTHTWSLSQGGTPFATFYGEYSEIERPCSQYNIVTFWFKVQDSSGSQITHPLFVDCDTGPWDPWD
jgi:hypothetical protein